MESLFHQGLQAANTGDFASADAIARQLLQQNPQDVHAYQIIGFSCFRSGRTRDALHAFIHANKIEPNQPEILNWIGILLKDHGDYLQAREAFSNAAALAPENGEILCNFGEILDLLGDRQAAEMQYTKAVKLETPSATALAKAAIFFEKSHDLAQARKLAEKALTLDPENESALIALSDIDSREKKPEAIVERFEHIRSSSSPHHRNRARMLHLLAQAYDMLERNDDAFSAYSEANSLQRSFYNISSTLEKSPLTPDNLVRMIDFFSSEDVSSWTTHEGLEGETPVLLLGFSRSGTTWMDQILSSHPDFSVMEEEDNFIDAWRDFLLSDSGLNRLKALSHNEVNRYRRAYWERAKGHMGKDADKARYFVDKVPLNTVQLGLIYRLFPEAKILFSVRDPRDAVMSCFQQHFAINAAMYQFTSLDSAAVFYDRVMTLGQLGREKFPMDIHNIRYEHLVENLEAELRPIFEFLGAEWNPSVLAYDKTALGRPIHTPSARQVIQKPYASSIGKWRRYRKHLEPVLPKLNKWALHFGYAVD